MIRCTKCGEYYDPAEPHECDLEERLMTQYSEETSGHSCILYKENYTIEWSFFYDSLWREWTCIKKTTETPKDFPLMYLKDD